MAKCRKITDIILRLNDKITTEELYDTANHKKIQPGDYPGCILILIKFPE